MVAYTKPHKRKKGEGEGLKGEGDQINFIDLRFERWQVVRFRKARKDKMFLKLHVLWINDDSWEEVHGLGSENNKLV